ncbi:hypothetical protein V6N13_073178 [Hibiscus sabdariffa]
MSSLTYSDTANIVGHWGESFDDFSEDEENIVPIMEDDDVHLLDVGDVEIVMTDATEGNGLNVENDVWIMVVARLGLENEHPVLGYVRPETEQLVPNYLAYEPPTHMYDAGYTVM